MSNLVPAVSFFIFAAGCLYTGYQLDIVIHMMKTHFRKKKFLKNATTQKVDQNRLCSGQHSWTMTDVVYPAAQGPVTRSIRVCLLCGYLPGEEKMVSKLVLDNLDLYSREKEAAAKVYEEFVKNEENAIKTLFKKELEAGMDAAKLIDVFQMGGTHNLRYNEFHAKRFPELMTDSEKSNA